MTSAPISYDSSYHRRHGERAAKKAQLVGERISTGSSILDIGCNTGLVSKDLIERGIASAITGLEIDGSILHPYLKRDSNFRLIEGEIQEATFSERYDSAIYFSVHHHIVAHHGLDVAIRTLRNIATHCRTSLFFETGKISEGSYWAWQPELRRTFRFDEEHYCHLFRCLEDLIEDFTIIGYNRIHGIRREIFELRIRSETGHDKIQSELARHRYADDVLAGDEPEILYESHLTKAERIKDSRGRVLFKKSHIGNPLANYREHLIASRLTDHWAVSSIGLTSDVGIVFPFIRGIESNLSSPENSEKSTRHAIAEEVKAIRGDLVGKTINLSEPSSGHVFARSVYSICDFNPSNLLLVRLESGERCVRVVDFAYQSHSYTWKNDLNFAQALENLGESRLFRTYLRLRGSMQLLVKLLQHQLLTRKQRIINRFPSLLGAVVTELTNRLGLAFGKARFPRNN